MSYLTLRSIGRLFQLVGVCGVVFVLVSGMGIFAAVTQAPWVMKRGDWLFFAWVSLGSLAAVAVGLVFLKIGERGMPKEEWERAPRISLKGSGLFWGVHYSRVVYFTICLLAILGVFLPWHREYGAGKDGIEAGFGWFVLIPAILMGALVVYDVFTRENRSLVWWSRAAGAVILLMMVFEMDYLQHPLDATAAVKVYPHVALGFFVSLAVGIMYLAYPSFDGSRRSADMWVEMTRGSREGREDWFGGRSLRDKR